eukprot:6315206-Alexandrium_andersonii.AAC.1
MGSDERPSRNGSPTPGGGANAAACTEIQQPLVVFADTAACSAPRLALDHRHVHGLLNLQLDGGVYDLLD